MIIPRLSQRVRDEEGSFDGGEVLAVSTYRCESMREVSKPGLIIILTYEERTLRCSGERFEPCKHGRHLGRQACYLRRHVCHLGYHLGILRRQLRNLRAHQRRLSPQRVVLASKRIRVLLLAGVRRARSVAGLTARHGGDLV